jgi:hypothetical protein
MSCVLGPSSTNVEPDVAVELLVEDWEPGVFVVDELDVPLPGAPTVFSMWASVRTNCEPPATVLVCRTQPMTVIGLCC